MKNKKNKTKSNTTKNNNENKEEKEGEMKFSQTLLSSKIGSVLTCACAVCSNRCVYVSCWVIVLAANCLPAAATAPAAHQDACTRLRAILGDTCRE